MRTRTPSPRRGGDDSPLGHATRSPLLGKHVGRTELGRGRGNGLGGLALDGTGLRAAAAV